ncbi:MAG: hypothetical protein NY202_03650 [Mollicutes bacterium UO1]
MLNELETVQNQLNQLKEKLAEREEAITELENNYNNLLADKNKEIASLQTKHDHLNRGYLGKIQQAQDLNKLLHQDYSELEEKLQATERNGKEKERQLTESSSSRMILSKIARN